MRAHRGRDGDREPRESKMENEEHKPTKSITIESKH